MKTNLPDSGETVSAEKSPKKRLSSDGVIASSDDKEMVWNKTQSMVQLDTSVLVGGEMFTEKNVLENIEEIISDEINCDEYVGENKNKLPGRCLTKKSTKTNGHRSGRKLSKSSNGSR